MTSPSTFHVVVVAAPADVATASELVAAFAAQPAATQSWDGTRHSLPEPGVPGALVVLASPALLADGAIMAALKAREAARVRPAPWILVRGADPGGLPDWMTEGNVWPVDPVIPWTEVAETIVREGNAGLMPHERTMALDDMPGMSSSMWGEEDEAAAGPERGARLPVFYGTDRERSGDDDLNDFYGGGDGDTLEMGIVEVSIPPGHEVGEIERPEWWRFELSEDPDKHLMLVDLHVLDADDFRGALRGALSEADAPDIMLFVHGYKVSFADAARRTAQMAYDLRFPGQAALYSWPSDAELFGYFRDEDTIGSSGTTERFETFLNMLRTEVGARTVHVISHSMGTRLLAGALHRLDPDSLPQDAAALRQVVFAAPDIDADDFRAMAAHFPTKAERITVYGSKKDKALWLSGFLHGGDRTGHMGDAPVVVADIDTVDVSDVDTKFLAHSSNFEDRGLINDLRRLLVAGDAPDRRGLLARKWDALRYWAFPDPDA